jgi:hypothetical protein
MYRVRSGGYPYEIDEIEEIDGDEISDHYESSSQDLRHCESLGPLSNG